MSSLLNLKSNLGFEIHFNDQRSSQDNKKFGNF
jgi:hypothetical protein